MFDYSEIEIVEIDIDVIRGSYPGDLSHHHRHEGKYQTEFIKVEDAGNFLLRICCKLSTNAHTPIVDALAIV